MPINMSKRPLQGRAAASEPAFPINAQLRNLPPARDENRNLPLPPSMLPT